MNRKLFTLLLVICLQFACAKKIPPKWSTQNSMLMSSAINLQDDLDKTSLILALNNSISYFQNLPADRTFTFGNKTISKNQMIASQKEFINALHKFGLSKQLNDFLAANFDFYKSASSDVLVTGYFEPALRGSFTQSEKYFYPLYRKPNDLVTVKLSEFFPNNPELPQEIRGRLVGDTIHLYYDREAIDYKQSLANKGLELVWVDDLLDAFFLHIQGSGIVYLDNGNKVRVNYANQNGHPYRAIGKYLVDRGYLKLKDASMQGIKKALRENPQIVKDVLSWNPSYVFFRKVDKGPIGSIGQVLTPFRSIALDKSIFPRGSLAVLKSSEPVFDTHGNLTWKPFTRFVVNQDTGGAINGAGRVDYFMGHGNQSAEKAGVMKQAGELFFLLKKS
ncbi:MAG: MltA domain-containing protein [Bdellovibrionales bacterium]|nr:MltA domain-containing protein [Bdellovibrionales bacterium]